jgi:hypothetical protein
MILAKDVSGAREYELSVSSTPQLNWRTYNSSETVSVAQWGSSFSLSTWYCIHAWHDSAANQIGVVVNAGTPVTAAAASGVHADTADFRIGSRQFVGFEAYFDGIIDEVGFWRRVLTSQERTDLYNGGAGLAYSSFGGGGGGGDALMGQICMQRIHRVF